ncbi:MAG: hypothetical protein L6V35_03340 [Alistipes putredinis]|nr:MAG: hypothetical protein L6V35_03340 [Alistipes putredinis]
MSAPIRNVSYARGANVKAVFGPLHTVFLTLDVRRQPADFDDMFLNPAKSNLTHEDVRSSVRTRLRLGYDFNMAGRMRLQFSLSGDIARGRTEIIRYYDDLSSMFSDAAVSYGMQALCGCRNSSANRFDAAPYARTCGKIRLLRIYGRCSHFDIFGCRRFGDGIRNDMRDKGQKSGKYARCRGDSRTFVPQSGLVGKALRRLLRRTVRSGEPAVFHEPRKGALQFRPKRPQNSLVRSVSLSPRP